MTAGRAIIELEKVDHPDLIGSEMKIRSEQFPGRILETKVVGISGDSLIIDRSGSEGLVNELINKQDVDIFIKYKGEPVVFRSKITIPVKGRLQIPLAAKLFPEINRAFLRVSVSKKIRLAYFNDTGISTARLNKLKWIETNTVNLGGGGAMIRMPIHLTDDFYLIMHLGLLDLDIPKLLIGQVRHSNPNEDNKFFTGVEFAIRETYMKKLPRGLIRNLPAELFTFDDNGRKILAAFIEKNSRNI